MVYIQLSEPIRGYNKVAVTQFSYFEQAEFGADTSISFKYIVFKDVSSERIVLYEKVVDINDEFINRLKNQQNKNLSSFDGFCRILLEYLIENSIETGTLEVR